MEKASNAIELCNINYGNKTLINDRVIGETKTFGWTRHQQRISKCIQNALDTPEFNQAVEKETKRVQKEQEFKSWKNNINYSRFDYAGGSEDEGYKLALDSFKTDQDKLSMIYEKLVKYPLPDTMY